MLLYLDGCFTVHLVSLLPKASTAIELLILKCLFFVFYKHLLMTNDQKDTTSTWKMNSQI